ncbi:MAG: hypothetical protein AAFO58_09690 [Pseudomonadota bacterium]
MSTLDEQLLAAHEAGDKAALIALYTQAAETAGTQDARLFFLTQAHVFALDAGAPEEPQLRARLRAAGRSD